MEEILKYYSQDKVRTTLCDHEGKEISIDELVGRYYTRPEDYFEATGYPKSDNDNNDCNSDS